MEPLLQVRQQLLKNALCAYRLRLTTYPTRKRIGSLHPSHPVSRHINVALNLRNNEEHEGEGPELSQAYPLRGYYSEITNTPSRATSSILSNPATPSTSPTAVPFSQLTEQSAAEKLSIIFGTRLAGPGYSSTRYNPANTSPESIWQTTNGSPILLQPDNCCMSGCAHCVWNDY